MYFNNVSIYIYMQHICYKINCFIIILSEVKIMVQISSYI